MEFAISDEVYDNLYLSDDNPDLPAVLPSAPPDLGSFYIRLHWPEVGLPQRWAPMLQKALQTWMNITLLNEINVRCNIHRLQPLETPGCAEVQLTPFAALSKILTKKSSHLTFKDLKQTAVVDFYSSAAQMNKSTDTMKNGQTALQIPIKVNAVVDVQNFSPQVQDEVMKRFKTYSSGPHNLCIQGTLEDVNMCYDKLQQVVLQKEQLENSVSHTQPPTTTQNSESPKDLTLKVPLFQYTAACKAHGNKIRQILEENRVAMQAEVALSFKHQGNGVDMSSKACQEISKLLQSMGPPALNQTDSTTVERKQQPQSTGFGLPQEHSLGSKESPMMKESVASCNRPTEETAATAKAVCGVEAAHEEHVNNNNNQMLVHHVGKSNLKKASQQNQLSGIETTAPLVQTGRHCPICLKGVKNNLCLPCGDNFCGKCIEKALIKGQSRSCPLCQEDIEKIVGDQPKGKMTVDIERESLPGFLVYNTIRIDYDMPGAVQTKDHPRPGKQFRGLRATAYLPDSPDGQNVVQLLKRAFTQRLVFTVGASSATGEENCVLWNIPHKTSKYGGPSSSGYPDPDYIKKVKEELKAKGIE